MLDFVMAPQGLPPGTCAGQIVVTASHDILRSEGDAYADRLGQAGVPVQLLHYDGMIHGFLRMPMLVDEAVSAVGEIAAALRR